jgi:hypothetical protein
LVCAFVVYEFGRHVDGSRQQLCGISRLFENFRATKIADACIPLVVNDDIVLEGTVKIMLPNPKFTYAFHVAVYDTSGMEIF